MDFVVRIVLDIGQLCLEILSVVRFVLLCVGCLALCPRRVLLGRYYERWMSSMIFASCRLSTVVKMHQLMHERWNARPWLVSLCAHDAILFVCALRSEAFVLLDECNGRSCSSYGLPPYPQLWQVLQTAYGQETPHKLNRYSPSRINTLQER